MKANLTIAALSAALLATGCTSNVSPSSYSVGSVGQVNRVVRGTILSAREVLILGNQTGIGATAGTAAGAAAGSTIGGDSTSSFVGAVAGAVVVGIAGATAEERSTRQKGVEYVIESETGAILTLVQGPSDPLKAGDHVLVIYGERCRIIKDPGK